LVDETLKIAEISSLNTKYNIKDFNFSNLINSIIEENKPLFEMKKIKINNKFSSNLIVNADELKIKEVLNNLISNAIKYSEDNGEVSLNYKIENNKIIFSISDSGKGLNDDQLNHIFDEFYKADESRHNLSSSGLGLSICKRIIEKHGENIWAESKGIGYGTTLYFTLKIGGS
jgi:signal transduction histidine kinase